MQRVSPHHHRYVSSLVISSILLLPPIPCSRYLLQIQTTAATHSFFTCNSYKHPQASGEGMDRKSEEGKGDNKTNKRVSDQIMPHILKLYGSCAGPEDFEIYAPDASFEDPLMHAHGVNQIKSAFYSLPKVFSESKIVEYDLQETEISPGKQEILVDNKQRYKFLGRSIDLVSLITLHVENGKVIRHEDWWDKKPLKNKDTVGLPLVGQALEMVRRGSMLLTHAMMGFGKDPK